MEQMNGLGTMSVKVEEQDDEALFVMVIAREARRCSCNYQHVQYVALNSDGWRLRRDAVDRLIEALKPYSNKGKSKK